LIFLDHALQYVIDSESILCVPYCFSQSRL
jgi:hypothetical protein